MGQVTDADSSYEVTDNPNAPKISSVYKTLAIGWVLGAILILSVTKPSFTLFIDQLLPVLFFMIICPPVWLFVYFVLYIQYLFVKELEISKPNCGQYLGRILSGAILLCVIYSALFFIEQLILLGVRSGSEIIFLSSYINLKVEVLENLFHKNTLLNRVTIPLLGFSLGILIFTLLSYPYALVAFGLCIVVPSYKLLIAFTTGIIHDTPCFMMDIHKIGISTLFVPIGFGVGLILIGIRAVFVSRKISKSENTINNTKITVSTK